MDRRSIIKHAGIAGVLAAGVAPAVHAQAAVRWRLASSFPKSLDTIYGAAETFSKKVREMTGGKFEISVHAAGELVPMPGLVDAHAHANHFTSGVVPQRNWAYYANLAFGVLLGGLPSIGLPAMGMADPVERQVVLGKQVHCRRKVQAAPVEVGHGKAVQRGRT